MLINAGDVENISFSVYNKINLIDVVTANERQSRNVRSWLGSF